MCVSARARAVCVSVCMPSFVYALAPCEKSQKINIRDDIVWKIHLLEISTQICNVSSKPRSIQETCHRNKYNNVFHSPVV